jgi:Alginate lyase.
MNRREFSLASLAIAILRQPGFAEELITADEIARIDRARILGAANIYLNEKPITVTATSSPRSHGGPHDYFSEGDYWWPDPKNPSGPYIRRDGYSNPENFNAHREALIRLSLHVPALTAAFLIARKRNYAVHAALHLRAWFIDRQTRMNPSLQYAQAISGVTRGRGIGIIDTLHLIEVSRAAMHLQRAGVFSSSELQEIQDWFVQYLDWMLTSKNGQEEAAAENNHGTCWVAQAAAFADFTRNRGVLKLCREHFRNRLLPGQLGPDGSFPLELSRTKPYSYSLFNLDVLSIVCRIAAVPNSAQDDLWQFQLPVGISYKKAVDFMFPFIQDKKRWPYKPDVEYFDDLPNRQISLLFAGIAYHEPRFIALWRMLPPDPKTAEIIRNFPLRQPLLWIAPAES